jgi:hypothetical protein
MGMVHDLDLKASNAWTYTIWLEDTKNYIQLQGWDIPLPYLSQLPVERYNFPLLSL